MNDKLSLYKLTAALFSLLGLFFVEAGISYNPLEFGLGKIFTAIFFGVVGWGTWYNFFVGKFPFGYYRGHLIMYINSFVFFISGVIALLSVWMHHNLFLVLLGVIAPVSFFVSVKVLGVAARKHPQGQDFFKIYFNRKNIGT